MRGEDGLRGVNLRQIVLFGTAFDRVDARVRSMLVAGCAALAIFAMSHILDSRSGRRWRRCP